MLLFNVSVSLSVVCMSVTGVCATRWRGVAAWGVQQSFLVANKIGCLEKVAREVFFGNHHQRAPPTLPSSKHFAKRRHFAVLPD